MILYWVSDYFEQDVSGYGIACINHFLDMILQHVSGVINAKVIWSVDVSIVNASIYLFINVLCSIGLQETWYLSNLFDVLCFNC